MTERQKQVAIISGVVIVAILLLLFTSKGQEIVRRAAELIDPVIQLPDIPPPVNGGPIILPPFIFPDRDLQMIGSCCMDCASSTLPTYNPYPSSGFTYVYNAGDAAPVVYNYTTVSTVYEPPQQTWTGGLRSW